MVEDFWLQSNNMKSDVKIKRGRSAGKRENIRKIMKCLCSGEKTAGDDMIPAAESPSAFENSGSGRSSRTGEIVKKPEIGNIEEAESSLRESGCLNYEVRILELYRLQVIFLGLFFHLQTYFWRILWSKEGSSSSLSSHVVTIQKKQDSRVKKKNISKLSFWCLMIKISFFPNIQCKLTSLLV